MGIRFSFHLVNNALKIQNFKLSKLMDYSIKDAENVWRTKLATQAIVYAILHCTCKSSTLASRKRIIKTLWAKLKILLNSAKADYSWLKTLKLKIASTIKISLKNSFISAFSSTAFPVVLFWNNFALYLKIKNPSFASLWCFFSKTNPPIFYFFKVKTYSVKKFN